jgi:hypothetical protein
MITIESAFYGANDETATDVTSVLANLLNGITSKTTITVNQQTLGLNLPPKVRALSVNYHFNGLSSNIHLTKSGIDGSTMTFNSNSFNFGIVKATYGTSDFNLDITDNLKTAILLSDDNVAFKVGSSKFLIRFCNGYDPAPNVQKVFCITYENTNWCVTDGGEVNLAVGP